MSSHKGARVSIPDSVRKMIQNIHEVTGAHEDEIYVTLKECAMDPNETVQRILSQDTFHEVKSKRDRRKENSSIKEPSEPRWKPGQGRGSRGGRGSYSSRYTSNDTGGRISSIGKENTSNQASEKIAGPSSSSASQEPKKNETTVATSSTSATANGPSALVAKGAKADISKLGGPASHKHLHFVKENPRENSGTGKTHGRLISSSSNNSATETQVTSPGSHFSSSDPVLVPSQDSRTPGAAGTIKREVGCQRTFAEPNLLFPSEGKMVAATSEVGNFSVEGNIIQTKSIGVEKNHQSDTVLRPSSAHGGSSLARPLSNHSSRSQVVGPPKVVSSKEWKPKSSNPSLAQGSSTTGQSEVSAALEVNTESCPVTGDLDSKEGSTKLQRKLEELHIPDSQHVILPNHLHVPGAEKISFCFGSFDAISLGTGFKNVLDDSIPAPPSETCQSAEETEDQMSSLQTEVATTEEGDYHDHPHSPALVPENLSFTEQVVPSAGSHEYGELKQESDFSQGSLQYPMVHASSGYGFGLVPTMMGSQLPPFENSESQARDISRVPSFVVPQPFDLASYYAQFYRSADSDGRISPFHAPGVATKYNGSVAVLPSQTSQPAQEGGNSLVMSTSGPTAFTTQPAAGVVPSSIAVTQQTVPVFRQPFGIPFPHYPPNFMPYGPYFSPLFVPHFNQSLNNSAYPPQPQAGGIYPAVPGPSPKFPFSQYKAGTSSGNSTSVGVANSYGSYGPSASTAGNSTTNEDLTAQQLKESNVYITGQQQNEGSGVWLAAPGRDMSGVQASSFYNIPSQGQVAFAQPQPGHGPFTGIYHTAQVVSATAGHPLLQQSQTMASAVDIAAPPAPNVYQQSQHTQATWGSSNY